MWHLKYDLQRMQAVKWDALLFLQWSVRFKISVFALWFIYYLTLFLKENCLVLYFLPINLCLVNKMLEKDWFCCLQVPNNFYKWIHKAWCILLNVYWKTLCRRGLFNEQRIWTEKNLFFIYCKSVFITQCWRNNRKDIVFAQCNER